MTGLTPLITIVNAITGVVLVDNEEMEEIGSGFYRYDFPINDGESDYVIKCDGGDTLPANERYNLSSSSPSGEILDISSRCDDIKTAMDNIYISTQKKI
uniref:Uncharacterized protein n=1 Tax=viral metagenome TaxID=1070528 RepID=A0A6M3KIP0_9ZZZZ